MLPLPSGRAHDPPTAIVAVADRSSVSTLETIRQAAIELREREHALRARAEALEAREREQDLREGHLDARETICDYIERRDAVREAWGQAPDESGGLGVVDAFLDAPGTLAAWVTAIDEAAIAIRIYCYTFDHPLVVERLEAARARKVEVEMTVDSGRVAMSRNEEAALLRLAARGVKVNLASGQPLATFYAFRAGDSRASKRGDQHAKLLLADQVLVIGSTNFTKSSQANGERAVRVRLTPAGVGILESDTRSVSSAATPFRP